MPPGAPPTADPSVAGQQLPPGQRPKKPYGQEEYEGAEDVFGKQAVMDHLQKLRVQQQREQYQQAKVHSQYYPYK